MFVIAFYVPTDAAEVVKKAMFSAGAGKIGDYDSCCWQTLGQGQFKPLKGAKPAIGTIDSVETVEELKVEIVVAKACVKAVVLAMLESHPYEEPAYHIFESIALESL